MCSMRIIRCRLMGIRSPMIFPLSECMFTGCIEFGAISDLFSAINVQEDFIPRGMLNCRALYGTAKVYEINSTSSFRQLWVYHPAGISESDRDVWPHREYDWQTRRRLGRGGHCHT